MLGCLPRLRRLEYLWKSVSTRTKLAPRRTPAPILTLVWAQIVAPVTPTYEPTISSDLCVRVLRLIRSCGASGLEVIQLRIYRPGRTIVPPWSYRSRVRLTAPAVSRAERTAVQRTCFSPLRTIKTVIALTNFIMSAILETQPACLIMSKAAPYFTVLRKYDLSRKLHPHFGKRFLSQCTP